MFCKGRNRHEEVLYDEPGCMSGAIYVLSAAIVLVIASAASLLSSYQKLQP